MVSLFPDILLFSILTYIQNVFVLSFSDSEAINPSSLQSLPKIKLCTAKYTLFCRLYGIQTAIFLLKKPFLIGRTNLPATRTGGFHKLAMAESTAGLSTLNLRQLIARC